MKGYALAGPDFGVCYILGQVSSGFLKFEVYCQVTRFRNLRTGFITPSTKALPGMRQQRADGFKAQIHTSASQLPAEKS